MVNCMAAPVSWQLTRVRLQLRVLTISLGYFVYDTIACALIEDDRANAAHHLCSIAAVCVRHLPGVGELPVGTGIKPHIDHGSAKLA